MRPRTAESGVATILIVSLLGLSMTVSVVGVAYYIRSTQAQTTSMQAQTQAQMKAWTGVELMRQYLQKLRDDNKLGDLGKLSPPVDLTLSAGAGVNDMIDATLTAMDPATQTFRVRIEGATALGSAAEARALVEAVYDLQNGPTSQCSASPPAATVFKGNTTLSGGGTSIRTSSGEFRQIAVDGVLTITGSSPVKLSGCAKSDINMSGGGVAGKSVFHSENGDIVINSMSGISGGELWGNNISIGTSGSNSLASIKTGSYLANVVSGGSTVGTARVGGRLIQSTVSSPASLPWTQGTIVPWSKGTQAKPGGVFVTLSGGAQLYVDLDKVQVDAITGEISGATAPGASLLLSGSGSLPDRFSLVATGISGGNFTLCPQAGCSPIDVSGPLWGHAVSLGGGAGGSFQNLWANDSLSIDRRDDRIAWLVGGNDLLLPRAVHVVHSQWYTQTDGFPQIGGGQIAGRVMAGTNRVPASAAIPNFNLSQEVSGTTPGLPGALFCDTRINPVSVDQYKSQANFVFEGIRSGTPTLTVLNVMDTRSNQLVPQGPYDLRPSAAALPQQIRDMMLCGWGNAPGCRQRSGGGWLLDGVSKFPAGVAWFDDDLTVSSLTGDAGNKGLLNTMITRGMLTLTSNANRIVAPNFAVLQQTQLKLGDVCGGRFRPENLCASPSALRTWTDAQGAIHNGVPIANMGVVAEGDFNPSGWTIWGHVLAGGRFHTGGSTVHIYGTLAVGLNAAPGTLSHGSTAGGLEVDTSVLSGDQQQGIDSTCTPSPTGAKVRVKWARYL